MLITGYTDLYDRHFGSKDSNLARLPDECAVASLLVAAFLSIGETQRGGEHEQSFGKIPVGSGGYQPLDVLPAKTEGTRGTGSEPDGSDAKCHGPG